MPEINIEKKDSGGVPWWAWLLGLLALAAVIWFALSAMSAKTVTPTAIGADNSAIIAPTDNSAMADSNSAMTDANTALDNSAMMASNSAMTDANSAMSNGAMATDNSAMATDNSAMSNTSMSNSAPGNSTVPAAPVATITNILSVVDPKDPSELYGKNVKLAGAPVQAAGTKVFWIGPSFEQKMLVVTDASTKMNGINTGVAQRDRVNIEGKIVQITDFNDAKAKYNLDASAVTFLTNKKLLLMATSVERDAN